MKRRYAIAVDDEAFDRMTFALGYAIGRLRTLEDPDEHEDDTRVAGLLAELRVVLRDRVEDP